MLEGEGRPTGEALSLPLLILQWLQFIPIPHILHLLSSLVSHPSHFVMTLSELQRSHLILQGRGGLGGIVGAAGTSLLRIGQRGQTQHADYNYVFRENRTWHPNIPGLADSR